MVKLERGQFDAASQLLAAAFAPDPLWQAMIPHPELLGRSLGPVYDLVVRYGQRYGSIWADEHLDAVAVWLPSERAQATLWQEITCGALGVMAALGPRHLLRLMRVTEHNAKLRQALLPVPHTYLWALAVRPGRQGRGLGSELLRQGLAHCDREKRPAYLETHRAANVRLYARYGFVVRQHAPVPRLGTPQWSMARPAAAGIDG